MAEKFTPGPWVADSIGGQIWIGSEPDDPHCAFGRIVASMNQSSVMGARDIRQVEADARLIAAAPEMYEALKRALAHVTHEETTTASAATRSVLTAIAENLRKAIRKAEGQE